MTPIGQQIRELRAERGISLKKMAKALGVTAAYFSALEHGHRGKPSSGLTQQICGYFNLMWDAAEELQRLANLSHPRVVVDTSGLHPKATELANLLAEKIGTMDEDIIEWVINEIRGRHRSIEEPPH